MIYRLLFSRGGAAFQRLFWPVSTGRTLSLIKGKAALRAWWQDSFHRLPTLRYEIIRLTPYENRVFMEYIRHVKDEEDLMVGELLEVANGLIYKSSVFHQ